MANEIFKKLTESTGLPSDLVCAELEALLDKKGLNSTDVTMDELRLVLSEYLRNVISQAKDAFDQGFVFEEEVDPEELGD